MPYTKFPQFKSMKDFWEWFNSKRPSTVYLVKDKAKYDEVILAVDTIGSFALESNPNGTTISISQDELLATSICVEITTNLVVFEDMQELCSALEKADNLEITTTTKNKMVIGLVFENIYYFAPPTDDPFPESNKGYGEPTIAKNLK